MSEPNAAATVLVVDDNEANRTLAKDTLEDEGYRVVLADGGEAALQSFEEHLPDCVVLDVRMPGVDGFQVCERIRALPGGAATPIIFLTALRDVDTFDRALRAGGDDFLTKPVRPTELVVRVQAALKLRRLSAELHDHYELLKHQRDDLMRMQLQKERLTAFVVHDLKNPVNAMDLHAQLLLRDAGLSAGSRDSASQIRKEARQLNRMILNLLDLSKAEEGKLTPRWTEVKLAELVDDVFAELEVSAAARRVTLQREIAVESLLADADLLRRTLANLIDNAIRHTHADSPVQVSARKMAEGVEIRVRDHGRGVPESLRSKVFDPFVQLEDSAAAGIGGRGLGLAFCKLVAQAHGGRIWVEDAAPGAAFVLLVSAHP
jgi:signal transduction histidine kinase